jgi:hypothetical protein
LEALRYEQARIEDARRLAAAMRDVDRNAIINLGEDPEDMIATTIHASLGDAWVAHIHGELAAAWGIVPAGFVTGWAVPWLCPTPVVEKYPKIFYRESRRMLALLVRHYAYLGNLIDTRHEQSRRWAERLGFKIGEPVALGPLGHKFFPCTIGG